LTVLDRTTDPVPSTDARTNAPQRRLAVVSAADWDSANAKGTVAMLGDFDEAGYFDMVAMVFPFAPRSIDRQIAPRLRLLQFGYDAFPGAQRYRAVRLLTAPFLILRIVILLRRMLRTGQIDIVRATDPYWCAVLGWLASVGTGRAYCISIHSDWDQRHRLDPHAGAPKLLGSRGLAKWIERFMLRRAQRILCIRKTLIEYAVASGAPHERTRLIPHGIDLSLLAQPSEDVRQRFGLSRDAKLVMFAGRLSRENYVYEMLEVARALSDMPEVQLVLVGGGIEEEHVRAMVAADRDLARSVVLTGFVDREVALALRKAAAVNVVPMGGFSLIEACASGRPVVSYDVEWHAELIRSGQNGILVREGDVSGFSAAVRQLCQDPSLADRLGAAGRASAFDLHDLSKVRSHRIACYDELLVLARRGAKSSSAVLPRACP
jgi:glycosyltransferase involved in cell wall biosynthesis